MKENNSLFNKTLNFDKYALIFDGNEISCGLGFSKYETENSIIWLANPNNDSIKLTDLEKLDNKQYHVYDIKGIWSCLIKDKSEGNYRAITSIQNELPWYYSLETEIRLSSNIFLLTSYLSNSAINYEAISSFLAFDFCYNGETFLKNIKKTYGGDILLFKSRSINIQGCDITKWLGFDASISDNKLILEHFIKNVENPIKENEAQITLTAGSDSRAILGAAYFSGQDFTLMTGAASSTAYRDIKIASKIASILGKKHLKIDESKREINNINEAIEKVAIQTSALFIPRNWLLFYKEYMLNTGYLQNVTRLMGYRGEFFKGFYTNLSATISRKTFLLRKNYSNKLIETINERFNYYKNISSVNAYELFYHRERDNFWVSSNIRTMLQSGCKVYTPFSDNDLLKLGYRFEGGIKKINLHKLAIDLLPNQVKEIPTSNNKLTFVSRYIYHKIFNHNDYNFFLRPKFIKQNLNYDLLNEIMTVKEINSLISKYQLMGNHDTLVHKLFAVNYFFTLIDKIN